ncbi:hypothetical protein Verru16b_00892 [Lacunisphaera limnophila]|uniref:Uncharacterized protein n=1 Tax=Lacunisphaera limnophila TaxID=1838286 RepID=A0A1D8ASF8_9BACT|nr:hypothetical protein [Lacunisphaera limnophila]AOS43834.1 hypothetical protein Verru16b_00892 [Lacunisphaera limnophila]
MSRRIIAGVGAGLVLLLTVAAASPAVHVWLHGHAGDETHACEHHHTDEAPAAAEEAGCAVTLFCHGVLPLVVWRLPVVEQPTFATVPGGLSETFRAARPRYRHVPSHAPPVV